MIFTNKLTLTLILTITLTLTLTQNIKNSDFSYDFFKKNAKIEYFPKFPPPKTPYLPRLNPSVCRGRKRERGLIPSEMWDYFVDHFGSDKVEGK